MAIAKTRPGSASKILLISRWAGGQLEQYIPVYSSIKAFFISGKVLTRFCDIPDTAKTNASVKNSIYFFIVADFEVKMKLRFDSPKI